MKKRLPKKIKRLARNMQPSDALALVRKSIGASIPEMEGAEGIVHTQIFAVPAHSFAKMAIMGGEELSQPRQTVVHTVNLRKIVKAGDGTPLLRLVRARVDEEGKILKIVTSR